MDEKEVLAAAAEELTREGDIEEVEASLIREKDASFPVILFLFNVLNDVVVDPLATFANLTGVGWLAYMGFIWVPLWTANTVYLWGKVSFWRKKGLRLVFNWIRDWTVRRLVAAGFMSALPFASLLFPQCLFILVAHKRHNRFVKELLVAADFIGRGAASGNPFAMRRAAEAYFEYAATSVIREAGISERVGEKFGAAAQMAARRMEGNVIRMAKKRGGRALGRQLIQAERERRAASGRLTSRGGAPTSSRGAVRPTQTPSGQRVA
jgi:hypothetical protein